MNQEKIGKFIQKLRKENNLTQLELANKLGITDRAVSKWENGRGLPDLSLLKPLCDELGITLNEFMAGEKIQKEKAEEKFEENIISTIDFSNKKVNKTKKKVVLILAVAVIIFSLIITMFLIDVNRMNRNEPVVFSTWGYKYAPAENFSDVKIQAAIDEYIVEKNDSESHHYNNEKWFSSHRTYLTAGYENNEKFDVYAWVLEESYYLKNGEITNDSGSSIPYQFIVKRENDEYTVVDSRIPRDGSLYEEDMKAIFPDSVRKEMEKSQYDGTIENLKADIDKQVKLYFHK